MFQLTCDCSICIQATQSFAWTQSALTQLVYTTLSEHTYTLVANNLISSIMNFKIKSKMYECWNPVLVWLYENTPYPFNLLFWFLEQLRTPKVFYYDLSGDEPKIIKVK